MIFPIPIDRINWTTSAFLIGTFVLTLTAVPLYLWYFGIDWFHFATFVVSATATGFSITLGQRTCYNEPGNAERPTLNVQVTRRSQTAATVD